MDCYAKDVHPGYLFSTGTGWIEVTEVKRDRGLAKKALTNEFVHDVTITVFHRMTRLTETISCNGHKIFKNVIEGV